MVDMYRSAKLFHLNLDAKQSDAKVTHYEIAPNGDVEFETDFTLKIIEKHSKIENYTVSGKYDCSFANVEKQMHGKYGSGYRYRLLSDDIYLTEKFASAVL